MTGSNARPTICLNMIVKNEAHVIRRCLDSVRPFIDTWVIVDTGSTDGTQQVIRDCLSDIPGELHERPWRDFGANRTEALELARKAADYTLVIDADEVVLAAPGFRTPALTEDAYAIRHVVGDTGVCFDLVQLVRSRLPWRYEGVLHEFITCDVTASQARLPGLVTKGLFDSARNQNPTEKYRADAEVLRDALAREPDNTRYAFYLAQSHRDAGDTEQALDAYRHRAAMGGWDEEIWYSLFQIAVLLGRRGRPWPEVLDAYLTAYQFRPARAEPLCAIAAHYRHRGEHAIALLFASQAAALRRPNDTLFVDDGVYAWRALDELAIASFYTGNVDDAFRANQRLLGEGKLPPSERARVQQNQAFCIDERNRRSQGSRTRRKKRRR